MMLIICFLASLFPVTHTKPIVEGMASWFQPAPMYDGMNVCAWNINGGRPVNIFIVNEDNGRTASCRVIGSGPFYGGRVLDVSPTVAKELGFYSAGTAKVRVYLK